MVSIPCFLPGLGWDYGLAITPGKVKVNKIQVVLTALSGSVEPLCLVSIPSQHPSQVHVDHNCLQIGMAQDLR